MLRNRMRTTYAAGAVVPAIRTCLVPLTTPAIHTYNVGAIHELPLHETDDRAMAGAIFKTTRRSVVMGPAPE